MARITDQHEPVPRSVGRVLDLLEIVLDERQCTLSRAAGRADLTPTTALRHLRALEARGYLCRDGEGRYSAGPTTFRLAETVGPDDPLDRLVTAAQPHLDGLAEVTGESAYLVRREGTSATYLATASSARAIRHVGWVGQTISLDGTAAGAAFADPGTVATRQGAVEPDITAVSLAFVPGGYFPMALSVVGPSHRLDGVAVERVTGQLTATVAALRPVLDRPDDPGHLDNLDGLDDLDNLDGQGRSEAAG